jgi:nitroimidazol reductase NimA-like FMN-containing flavoprotein (pyridoxamine 5'-phosphate oxidase superfamily)
MLQCMNALPNASEVAGVRGELVPTDRTSLHRIPRRGSYDLSTVYAILDEALVCHLGFCDGGQPYVIPTTYGRIGNTLYVHGAAASRTLKVLAGGVPACVTVTLVDGLVLARSAFHHSMNYRSVVLFGTATPVTEPPLVRAALEVIVEHVVPGRADHVRPPNDKELRATSVLALPIVEGSAKVRVGPPIDDEEDLALPCWAGVIPIGLRTEPPIPDPHLDVACVLPDHVSRYARPTR